jgi:hypothetical protein
LHPEIFPNSSPFHSKAKAGFFGGILSFHHGAPDKAIVAALFH